MSPPAGTWTSLRGAARLVPHERRQLRSSVALGLGAILAATGLLATSGYLISRAAQRPDILALTAVITAVRGFALARAILRYCERLTSHNLALGVLARLRGEFFAVIAPLGALALGMHRRGELMARFVADVDTLQDLYLRALAPPVVAALMIVAVGLAAVLMLPAAGFVLIGCLLCCALVIPALTGLIAGAAGRRRSPVRAALISEMVESLDGSLELAVAGRGPDRVRRIDVLNRRLARIATRDALAATAATTLGALMTGATVTLLLLVGIPAVQAGTLNPVLLAALVLLAFGAFEGLAPLPAGARTLSGCAESARRLDDLRDLTPVVSDPERPLRLDGQLAPSLALNRIWFRYGEDEPWLLEDLNLYCEPGCRVAITGPSGSGKSTLAQLLVRFCDPLQGAVTLGGQDVRSLTLAEVRANVVLIAQDAFVFATSVRDNLLLARPGASDCDLWSALAGVQLDGWVRALPDQLDTLLGANGELASGGQRQRLTIARALISDARFIVLDEPTAQLDSPSARALIDAVDAAAGTRGLILITHRPEGIDVWDKRFELHDGRLKRGFMLSRPFVD
jgi:thiol reductant ABC exporter CydC subunit